METANPHRRRKDQVLINLTKFAVAIFIVAAIAWNVFVYSGPPSVPKRLLDQNLESPPPSSLMKGFGYKGHKETGSGWTNNSFLPFGSERLIREQFPGLLAEQRAASIYRGTAGNIGIAYKIRGDRIYDAQMIYEPSASEFASQLATALTNHNPKFQLSLTSATNLTMQTFGF